MHQNKWQAVTLFGKRVVISGNETGHLISELGRSLSRLPPEDICEIGFFVVPEFKAYLGNIFIC